MGYLLRAGAGLALFIGGLFVFNVKLQELLDIGTCASGNVPFQIAQECPEGTGTTTALLIGSVIGCLVGWAIFALRGTPPRSARRGGFSGMFGANGLLWGVFFAATGIALLVGGPYGELVDSATGQVVGRPDSQLGATITGVTFLVMGIPALLVGLIVMLRSRTPDRPKRPFPDTSVPRAAAPAAVTTAATDTSGRIAELERLQALRDSGALSGSEFEQEKARILGR
jgi:hypothetical protein